MRQELAHKAATVIDKADAILKSAERDKRPLTTSESHILTRHTKEIEDLNRQARSQRASYMPVQFKDEEPVTLPKLQFSGDYHTAFWHYVARGNRRENNAALYEGSSAAGGYAVPIMVDGKIVPLAPTDNAVRKLSLVVPTTKDILIPIGQTDPTATAKAEGDGTGSNVFTSSSPTLAQKKLSAFLTGDTVPVSWELAQDVPAMRIFLEDAIGRAVQVYEEDKFLNGSGSGEPEGLLASADEGVAHSAVALDKLLDLMGTLKEDYLANASWLMARSTSIAIRKLQVGSVFNPAFTTEGGQDYLYGFPLYYSAAMPTSGQLSKPIVFGDFKSAYIIGDRGGSDISLKLMDQTRATEGLIEVFAYRRTDGRVRRTEALKTFVVDSGS